MTSDASPSTPTMERTDMTPRAYYEVLKENPPRPRFGYGQKLCIVNVDPQKAFTRPDLYPATSYITDPDQMEHIDRLSRAARSAGLPVVWTRVGYMPNGADCGVWGTLTDTEDSLQNLKVGSERHAFDHRLHIEPDVDAVYTKHMPSAFFETPLQSFLVWHKVDTVVVTGGSTSGCVRATAVDSLSHGYRTVVPVECVADRHEIPHFANLCDMMLKYADIVPVEEVLGEIAGTKS